MYAPEEDDPPPEDFFLNFAISSVSFSAVKEYSALSETAVSPAYQPVNLYPEFAVAVRVTFAPFKYVPVPVTVPLSAVAVTVTVFSFLTVVAMLSVVTV